MLFSEQMLAALEQQDLSSAEGYFKRALIEDPEEVLVELGEYLEAIGFYPQAKEIYDQLLPTYPELAINLAQIAAEDGDIEAAFAYLDQISPESEHYLSVLLVKADLYQMEGLSDVAQEKLLEAEAICQDPLITFGLAELALELEQYDLAIDRYSGLDPEEIKAATGISIGERLGRCYASLGNFEQAIYWLEQALDSSYDDQLTFELALLLYEQGEYQRANLHFKQLVTLNPDFEGYAFAYATSLHAEHRTKEALTVAQTGLAQNRFDVQLLLLASQLSYALHDKEAAEGYLLTARDLAEDTEDVLLRLSSLYVEEGRYEDVVAFPLDEVDNVLTRWHIAKSYRELEDDRAYDLYHSLFEDLQDNPEFLQDFIYVLREYGYKDRLLEVLKRYLALVPDDIAMVELLEDYERE